MRVCMINDCAHVGEDLANCINSANGDIEVTLIKGSRRFLSKTFGALWNIAKLRNYDLYHVHYALQYAYLVSKLKRLDILHCTLPNTLILGDNKPIADFAIGDHCIGLTGYQQVQKTLSRLYNGPIMEIKASGLLPLTVTPEHPFLTITRRDWYAYSKHQLLKSPRGHGTVHQFAYSEPYWKEAKLLVPKHSHLNGDCLLVPKLKGRSYPSTINLKRFAIKIFRSGTRANQLDSIEINENVAWLIGLYVAEGSHCYGIVRWSLSKLETHLIERTQTILSELGYRSTVEPNHNGVNVQVLSTRLGRFLQQTCGHHAKEKQVPDFILFNNDLRLAQAFFDGYFAGDGYIPLNRRLGSDGRRATTVSPVLAFGIQLLGVRLGFITTIGKQNVKPRIMHGKPCYPLPLYEIRAFHPKTGRKIASRIIGTYQVHPIKSIKILPYAGMVHNIDTTDNTYLISNAVVHNCHGSDVRWTLHSKKWGWIVRHDLESAKVVLYSTPDLSEKVKEHRPDATYLPTPVRINLFSQKQEYTVPLKAVYFKLPYERLPLGLDLHLEHNNITLDILERNVPYEKMPETLRKYDIFVDRFSIPSFSKTCLEAQSCGLATVDYRHASDYLGRVEELSSVQNVMVEGQKNRWFVLQNHDVRRVADQLSKIWRF